MINKNVSIEREVIVPYLMEHPEEVERLVKRLIELKPLAVEFIRCFFLLNQYAEAEPTGKKPQVTSEDVKRIADILSKAL